MGPAIAPARPAKAHPIPKTSSQMRLRSMPRARTMSGSREPARMTRPTLVRVRKAQRASSTTTVTAMTKRRYAGKAVNLGFMAFPAYRLFVIAVTVVVLLALWAFLTRTNVGLVIRAGSRDPLMVRALVLDL